MFSPSKSIPDRMAPAGTAGCHVPQRVMRAKVEQNVAQNFRVVIFTGFHRRAWQTPILYFMEDPTVFKTI
jgi:hypothetical protein